MKIKKWLIGLLVVGVVFVNNSVCNAVGDDLDENPPQDSRTAMSRRRFTPEEDKLIKDLVEKEGKNWALISDRLKNRTPRQCRERYNVYLNPNLYFGPWTDEEDKLLLDLHKDLGNQWTKISRSFPRRGIASIKNRVSVLKRGKFREKINDIVVDSLKGVDMDLLESGSDTNNDSKIRSICNVVIENIKSQSSSNVNTNIAVTNDTGNNFDIYPANNNVSSNCGRDNAVNVKSTNNVNFASVNFPRNNTTNVTPNMCSMQYAAVMNANTVLNNGNMMFAPVNIASFNINPAIYYVNNMRYPMFNPNMNVIPSNFIQARFNNFTNTGNVSNTNVEPKSDKVPSDSESKTELNCMEMSVEEETMERPHIKEEDKEKIWDNGQEQFDENTFDWFF